jgi:hypothetical protein
MKFVMVNFEKTFCQRSFTSMIRGIFLLTIRKTEFFCFFLGPNPKHDPRLRREVVNFIQIQCDTSIYIYNITGSNKTISTFCIIICILYTYIMIIYIDIIPTMDYCIYICYRYYWIQYIQEWIVMILMVPSCSISEAEINGMSENNQKRSFHNAWKGQPSVAIYVYHFFGFNMF